MGAAVQDRVRQVPHHPACQRCHRRSAEGRVLPSRKTKARADQREKMVADESMEEPDAAATRGFEPVVPTEPAYVQGLHYQRGLGEALGLSLRRRDAQLPAEMDGPTEVAAAHSLRGTRRHAGKASGGDLELLPDQSSLRRGRGYKNVRYLLLKAKRMAVTNAEFVDFQQGRKAA